MTGRTAASLAALLLLTSAMPAAAQPAELYGYYAAGVTRLDAARTFDAISGDARVATRSGGAHTVLRGRWFADVAFGRAVKQGERVFFDGVVPVALGIPLEVRLQHLDVAAGWRRRYRRLAAYAGAGVSLLAYDERSAYAEPGEDLATRAAGPLILAGTDLRVARWVHVGGELRVRHIPGILGEGGVSAAFGERSAGGVAVAVRLLVGR